HAPEARGLPRRSGAARGGSAGPIAGSDSRAPARAAPASRRPRRLDSRARHTQPARGGCQPHYPRPAAPAPAARGAVPHGPADEPSYKQARLDPGSAGVIAAEELASLEKWLEERWNATPRDTLLLMRLLRHLPGGEKLTKWTEAAPYLLAIVVATHHAFFGP